MYNYLKLIFILLMVTIVLIIGLSCYTAMSKALKNAGQSLTYKINYK